jgi:hypothetical protein
MGCKRQCSIFLTKIVTFIAPRKTIYWSIFQPDVLVLSSMEHNVVKWVNLLTQLKCPLSFFSSFSFSTFLQLEAYLNGIEENQINCTASKKDSNITIGNILWINNRDFFSFFIWKGQVKDSFVLFVEKFCDVQIFF